MAITFNKKYLPGIIIGLVVIILDIIFFFPGRFFLIGILLGVLIGASHILLEFFVNIQKQKEIESRFPDFVRNLVGAIKTGMPINKAILHVSSIDYGLLSGNVEKLANQLEWGIPIHRALHTFANDTGNLVIKRAVATVIEAEQSGGNIEKVLDAITHSVLEIKKLKQERQAKIHAQLVQGYLIFLVFLGVMVIIQNTLIPYVMSMQQGIGATTDVAGTQLTQTGFGGMVKQVEIDTSSFTGFFSSLGGWFISLDGVFLMLATIQGLFAGLTMGKLAEGQFKLGFKHSLILMVIAFIVLSVF